MIPDQKQGVEEIELSASSDADMPVRFAVIKGPVKREGNKLIFTKIPPRAKFPVKVTAAAYQWGRSVEPEVRSAEMVERSFFVRKVSI